MSWAQVPTIDNFVILQTLSNNFNRNSDLQPRLACISQSCNLTCMTTNHVTCAQRQFTHKIRTTQLSHVVRELICLSPTIRC